MYLIEFGIITFISLTIGLFISFYGIDLIETMIFSETIFKDVNLIYSDLESILYMLGISIGLVVLTSVLPLFKLLQMTPINIINKD